MSRRPFLSPARLAELSEGLGPEEHSILAEVATMRLATAKQLQRLHGVIGEAAVRRFRRRLARMTEARLLARLDRRIGGVRSGSAGFVYRLDIAGQRLQAPGAAGRRPWTPRPSWLGHALAVSQLYVDLATSGEPKLLVFEAEPTCWRPFTDGYGPAGWLKPDAFVVVRQASDELLAYVEVDQGTEAAATLVHKLNTYASFWRSGGAVHTGGVMPLVLWAVPTTQRRQLIQKLVRRQPPDAQDLHVVVLNHELVSYLARPP